MSKSNISQRNKGQLQISEATLQEMVKNSTRQLDIQEAQIKLRDKDIQLGFEFSNNQLKVQAEDAKSVRDYKFKMNLMYILSGIAVLGLIGWFVVYALNNDHSQLAFAVITHLFLPLS